MKANVVIFDPQRPSKTTTASITETGELLNQHGHPIELSSLPLGAFLLPIDRDGAGLLEAFSKQHTTAVALSSGQASKRYNDLKGQRVPRQQWHKWLQREDLKGISYVRIEHRILASEIDRCALEGLPNRGSGGRPAVEE